MFNLDQHVIESTKALATRADKVIQLADVGKTPEASAALLAMGREIGDALTLLSRCVQAHSILSGIIETLCERTETMQRAQGISESAMQDAFTWPPASVHVWDDLAIPVAFDDDEDDDGDLE